MTGECGDSEFRLPRNKLQKGTNHHECYYNVQWQVIIARNAYFTKNSTQIE